MSSALHVVGPCNACHCQPAAQGTCTLRKHSLALWKHRPCRETRQLSKFPKSYNIYNSNFVSILLLCVLSSLDSFSTPILSWDLTSRSSSQDGDYHFPGRYPRRLHTNKRQPSATGANWEKYQKKFADDEEEEKKITPLSDELVAIVASSTGNHADGAQGHSSPQDLRRRALRSSPQEARATNKREATECQ